ncbi:MAG: hypothetical protein NG712_02930, partial [Omnitrophica bacterium]|nr:hypothetical protein [Candidatus Omnitrophota bacterium]
RSLIERLSKSYPYLVIDNEAGMEHLSRRTTRKIDLLFLVSDYSLVGLRSAKRILDLSRELNLTVKNVKLIINRGPQKLNQVEKEIAKIGVPLAGVIPEDKELIKLSLESGNIKSLSRESKAQKAVAKICGEVI